VAKATKEQVFDDERKVVEVLRTHAKENTETIAKRCKLSAQKVSRIIAKLERENRIWGYSAIFDDEYFGLRHYYLIGSRTNIPLAKDVVEEILFTRLDDIIPSSDIFIDNIEYVNGEWDGVFSFFAKDITIAKRFMEIFNKRFHPYFKNLCLLETIYKIRQRGIRNPNIKRNLNLPLIDDSVDVKGLAEKK